MLSFLLSKDQAQVSPSSGKDSALLESVLKKSSLANAIVNNFINFILKRIEGGATVNFIITLLTGESFF